MDNQELEHAFLSVLNAGGIKILGDSKKFIAYMGDVTKGRAKKYDAIKVLLNNRYLEFFTSIGKPGEASASDVVESATKYACENLGIDREMASQVSVDMVHALEDFQGLQKTNFLQQKPNPKPRRQIPIEKEPQYVPETAVNAPPSNNTKKTSMTIVVVILWVVILVAAAFFVWKTFINKDSEKTTEVAKIDQEIPSASLAAEPGTTETETVAETQTPSPSVTDKILMNTQDSKNPEDEVEKTVKAIKEKYNQIKAYEEDGLLTSFVSESGVYYYFYQNELVEVYKPAFKGPDGEGSSQWYYYDKGKIIYAYYDVEGFELIQFFFTNEELIRKINTDCMTNETEIEDVPYSDSRMEYVFEHAMDYYQHQR